MHILKANILYHKQLYDAALEEYTRAEALGKGYKFPLVNEVYMSIGAILYQKERYDESLAYYQLVDTAYRMPAGIKSIMYNNMAGCYNYTDNYAMAEYYYTQSLETRKRLSDTLGMAISLINMGALYFDHYDNAQARLYWKKGLDLADQLKNNTIIEKVYYNLSLLEETEANYRKALMYYRLSDSIKKLSDNKENLWKLSQTERKLSLQSKQLQISELEKLNTKKELELTTRSTQRNVLIAASLGLLLIAGIVSLFLVQRNKASRIIAGQKNELETLNKTKDRLFSIIAHDLRSPVNALRHKNISALQSMESGDHSSATEMIRHIRKDTEQTSLLLNNLLHWSFTETGNLFLMPQPVLLKACIEQVIEELSFASREKNIGFDLAISERQIVYTDLNSLKIILRNLLQNAVKFSYLDQTIKISCKDDGTCVRIQIRDYGIGIPAGLQDRLFDMDHDKIRKGTNNEGGSGLGLWLIRDLLHKNNGHISVNPQTKPGTEITITLNHT